MTRVLGLVCWSTVLVGCQLLPPDADAGILTVPGSYQIARMTPGHTAHLALTGTKQVRCHDCHAIADAGFASPSTEVCVGCHDAQAAQHHPFDGGVKMNCLSCHVFRAATPTARFEKWACLDCHRETQGAAKPITVHLERCASCHRPHEAPFTQAATCTECHDVTLTHGEHGQSVAQRCMDCHLPHTPAVVASDQCVSCHQQSTMPTKARVVPQALFAGGHTGCGSCHTAHRFEKASVKACKGCHEGQVVLAMDVHRQCTSCHQPHAAKAQAKPCEGCHQKELASVKHPAQAGTGQRCIGCHPPHPDSAERNIAVACVSCHTGEKFASDVVHASTTSCDACHVPHGGKPKAEALCVTCHATQVTLAKKNPGHAKCESCHAGLPHGARQDPKPCLDCHATKAPSQAGHREAGCASCHQSHSAVVVKTCATCHLAATSKPLLGLHAVAKHNDCQTCHRPHEPQPGFGPATCKTCHVRLRPKEHPTPPTQCVGCHSFK